MSDEPIVFASLPMPTLTYVYAIKDETGVIVYVGQSTDPERRLAQHKGRERPTLRNEMGSPWCTDEHTLTILSDHIFGARAAERRAIREHQPIHNTQHNPLYLPPKAWAS